MDENHLLTFSKLPPLPSSDPDVQVVNLDAFIDLNAAQVLTLTRIDDDEEDFITLTLDCLDCQTNREEVEFLIMWQIDRIIILEGKSY